MRGETNHSTPKEGLLKGDTSFYFLGVKLFNKSYHAANPLFYADNWSHGLDESTTLHFFLGPIPMSAKLGDQGAAGLDFRMDLLPLKANSDIKPRVNSKVYIQVGADIVVGGAGGGSDRAGAG